MAQYEKGEDAVFIRIAMQDDDTGNRLRTLWQNVWQDKKKRDTFYYFLAKYDKMASQMPGYSLEKFVQKTFGTVCEEEWQKDICGKIRRRSGNE